MNTSNNDHNFLGMALILIGIYIIGKSFGFMDSSVLFMGWWPLILIIPALIGILRGTDRVKYYFILAVGVLLLLWKQGLIGGHMLRALVASGIFIRLGLGIISNNSNKKNQEEKKTEHKPNNRIKIPKNDQPKAQFSEIEDLSAIMVGKSYNCPNHVFHGCQVKTILGNYQIDLRQALIEEDIIIDINVVIGGVDLYLPDHVYVRNENRAFLGDVRDIRKMSFYKDEHMPIIYITGNCILGGLEIK